MEKSIKKGVPKWGEKSIFEKVLTVLSLFIAIIIIILSSLIILDKWFVAMNLVQPLVGVVMLLQVLQYWKYDKFVASISGVAAMCSFCVTIAIQIL